MKMEILNCSACYKKGKINHNKFRIEAKICRVYKYIDFICLACGKSHKVKIKKGKK